jgi:hypothetical protein
MTLRPKGRIAQKGKRCSIPRASYPSAQ